jgi:hypothetical protein
MNSDLSFEETKYYLNIKWISTSQQMNEDFRAYAKMN